MGRVNIRNVFLLLPEWCGFACLRAGFVDIAARAHHPTPIPIPSYQSYLWHRPRPVDHPPAGSRSCQALLRFP